MFALEAKFWGFESLSGYQHREDEMNTEELTKAVDEMDDKELENIPVTMSMDQALVLHKAMLKLGRPDVSDEEKIYGANLVEAALGMMIREAVKDYLIAKKGYVQ